MKRNLIVAVAVVLLAAGALYQNIWKHSGTSHASGAPEAAPKIHFSAPSFALKDLSGKTERVGGPQKEPYVINFWASWCGPCNEEADDLQTLYQEYRNQVKFYAVDVTELDSMGGVQKFVSKHHYTMPVLLDKKGKVMDLYHADSYPTSYFVDKNGVVQSVVYGLSTKQVWERQLAKLMRS